MNEYVYIAFTPAMPNFVKIGRTDRNPQARMAELYSTEHPYPFKTVISIKVDDSSYVEEIAHIHFRKYRANKNREFFELTKEQAIDGFFECLTVSNTEFKIDWSHSDKTIGIDNLLLKHQLCLDQKHVEIRNLIDKSKLLLNEALITQKNKLAKLEALGLKPNEPEHGLSFFLSLAFYPLPFGWLIWFGTLSVFSHKREGLGFFCIALLVVGAICHYSIKEKEKVFSKVTKPWTDFVIQIAEIENEITQLGQKIKALEFRFDILETSPLRKNNLLQSDAQGLEQGDNKNHTEKEGTLKVVTTDLDRLNHVSYLETEVDEEEDEYEVQLQIARETTNAIETWARKAKISTDRVRLTLKRTSDSIAKPQVPNKSYSQVNLSIGTIKFKEFIAYATTRNLEVDDLREKGRELWIFRSQKLGAYLKDKTASELEMLGFVWSNAREGWYLPKANEDVSSEA
jgi:hypothetical protein